MAEEKKETEKKAEMVDKAEKFDRILTDLADAGAKTWEDWLEENPEATVEEKHQQLRDFIKANTLTSFLMLRAMM